VAPSKDSGPPRYDRDVPLPRALARFNRRVTNPVLWPLVGRLPGFGHVVHVGRRSGRVRRTPVLAFRAGDRVVFALTYGPATEWARNVLVAGGCRFRSGYGELQLTAPRRFVDPSGRAVPFVVRPILRILGARDFLELRVVGTSRHRDDT
jgi:deazaflavin-dependent oxidoreductase (nitroreductase family)